MNENRLNIFGTALAWMGTVWAFYEHHAGAIVGLFAIGASVATMYSVLRRRRRERAKTEPETDL